MDKFTWGTKQVQEFLDSKESKKVIEQCILNEMKNYSWFGAKPYFVFAPNIKSSNFMGSYYMNTNLVMFNTANIIANIKEELMKYEIRPANIINVILTMIHIVVAHENRHIQQYAYLKHRLKYTLKEVENLILRPAILDEKTGEDILETDARLYSCYRVKDLEESMKPYIVRKINYLPIGKE